jgi:midasin
VAGTFRWQDGVVLQAMREGKRLLLDEISLASDSVLERLNSLLEPQRTLLLTDAGGADQSDMLGHVLVTAAPDFQLVATMNPGNDHGKKEVNLNMRIEFGIRLFALLHFSSQKR